MRTQERRYAWINAFMEVLVAGVLVGPAVITMKLPPVLSFQLHLNQIQVNTPARNTLRTSIFQSSGNNLFVKQARDELNKVETQQNVMIQQSEVKLS